MSADLTNADFHQSKCHFCDNYELEEHFLFECALHDVRPHCRLHSKLDQNSFRRVMSSSDMFTDVAGSLLKAFDLRREQMSLLTTESKA